MYLLLNNLNLNEYLLFIRFYTIFDLQAVLHFNKFYLLLNMIFILHFCKICSYSILSFLSVKLKHLKYRPH